MRLLLLFILVCPLVGMQPVSQPQRLSYTLLLEHMTSVGLCSYRKLLALEQKELALLSLFLLKELARNHELSNLDRSFLLSCIEGSKNAVRFNPSTILVRDLGVYLVVLAGSENLACLIYRAEGLGEKRSTFLKKLFFLGTIRAMPLLLERILKHVVFDRLIDTRIFFITVVPVFFYLQDRKLLERMCDVLGIYYLSHADKCMILAAFDDDQETIARCMAKDLLLAILIGYCLRSNQNRDAFNQVWDLFVQMSGGRSVSIGTFQRFLAKKAYSSNNLAMASDLGYAPDLT